jgi:hypothetical protein
MPRVVRGAGLAGCCATLGVAGHAAAGGELPPLAPTALLTFVLAGLGIALADRRRGFGSMLLVVVATQVGMHVLLAALAHGHGLIPVDTGMVAFHAAAALVTALLLAGAEGSVFALAAVLGWLLRGIPLRPLLVPAVAPAVRLRPATPPAELRLMMRRAHGRRGPPGLL